MPDAVVERLRRAGCVYAEDEAALLREAADDDAALERLVRRREAGEPLEVVVGWAEFCGLRIRVDPLVFVPRRRTELVARTAVELLGPGRGTRRIVVDLCCGTGAVAAVLASAYDDLELHAVDVEPHAVACARRNLAPPAEVHEGDLEAALPARLRGHRRPDHRQRALRADRRARAPPPRVPGARADDHGRRRGRRRRAAPTDRPGGGAVAEPGRRARPRDQPGLARPHARPRSRPRDCARAPSPTTISTPSSWSPPASPTTRRGPPSRRRSRASPTATWRCGGRG